MSMFRQVSYFSTPPVVKNLLIINALFFLAVSVLPKDTVNWMYDNLSLFYFESKNFRPHQLITYMFMHGGFTHIFFNMFALWMFGRVLEYDMGSKRFLLYYMACGVGAGLIQLGVNALEVVSLKNAVVAGELSPVDFDYLVNWRRTVGASGSIYGLLLAFGMLHPNSIIMLIFPPIPLKAKYFVIIFGLLELYIGFTGRADGIAHFAHLGGMLWGWILLRYWKKKGKLFY